MTAWVPRPVDTSGIDLPEGLDALVERLAANAHDVWGVNKLAGGWRYGPEHDGELHTHPDLVPYAALADDVKHLDREMAVNTLKLVISLGYSIRRS
jgi:ryanodine receptor 2